MARVLLLCTFIALCSVKSYSEATCAEIFVYVNLQYLTEQPFQGIFSQGSILENLYGASPTLLPSEEICSKAFNQINPLRLTFKVNSFSHDSLWVALVEGGGTCTFERQVKALQNAGASAVIIGHSVSLTSSLGWLQVPVIFMEAIDFISLKRLIINTNGDVLFKGSLGLVVISVFFCLVSLATFFKQRRARVLEQREQQRREALKRERTLKKIKKFKTFKYKNAPTDAEDTLVSCVICLQDFQEGQLLRELICGHGQHFHQSCIDTWLADQRRCPICMLNIYGLLSEEDTCPSSPCPSHTSDEEVALLFPRTNDMALTVGLEIEPPVEKNSWWRRIWRFRTKKHVGREDMPSLNNSNDNSGGHSDSADDDNNDNNNANNIMFSFDAH
ncbi:E3 ubiquitin-protein ligase RNF128-like isoform X2 [Zophobas morio]|uniref:E3 ubiquitin-protein ligase RNF128-like isoform X2 n=1 Tax=Zophobas morio TaxID=2755281 RepID=UPI0030829544